jgi:small nuclear ribonucleoprotein (snRNP)-like protein
MQRPFDYLEAMKKDRVIVKLTSGESIAGKLVAFDSNVNVVLTDSIRDGVPMQTVFIRGSQIEMIS